MAKSNNRYRGVYTKKCAGGGISYGIDYVHPGTGRRIQKILRGVKSEAEALRIRNIELADAERGILNTKYDLKSKAQSYLFQDMITLYLKWARENKRSWRTDDFRSRALGRFFEGKLLSDINSFLGEKYKIARSKTVTKQTVNKELSLARQIFDKGIEWRKHEGANPFTRVDPFKIKKPKKPGSLTPEQVNSIMDQIGHPVKRDMVEFNFYTGWRISEIRKLKWQDVNLSRKRAWIVDPKNGETNEIDLADKAIEVIERQSRRSDHVFCHLNGAPFKTNLHKVITNAAARAGIPLPSRKAWHILRRTWASMMLQSGCDIETLRVLGNWKDFTMPMWYADAGRSDHKREQLNKIPELENARKMGDSENVVSIRGSND